MQMPPAIDTTLVRQFVMVAHGDLAQVKTLLSQEPALVNAAWDWGGGDWETGLGAAAHTGQREIALFLLAQGARLDLFAAAMLGQLEVVKAILTTNPSQRHVLGPHKIPLLTHAKMGGDAAAAVLTYLESLTD
ncbi:MAG: ankyrin repeat domain-containing protein [Anaerolineae bacterium]|nr:ankyrin repeat domain-containing protein [Anaerolineae bacterium]